MNKILIERDKTNSSLIIIIVSLVALFIGAFFIIYYEVNNDIMQIYSTCTIYFILTLGAWIYSKFKKGRLKND